MLLFPIFWEVKNLPANAGDTGDTGSIPGSETALEKEMVMHSSILAWKIPWTEEPGGLGIAPVGARCGGGAAAWVTGVLAAPGTQGSWQLG